MLVHHKKFLALLLIHNICHKFSGLLLYNEANQIAYYQYLFFSNLNHHHLSDKYLKPHQQPHVNKLQGMFHLLVFCQSQLNMLLLHYLLLSNLHQNLLNDKGLLPLLLSRYPLLFQIQHLQNHYMIANLARLDMKCSFV